MPENKYIYNDPTEAQLLPNRSSLSWNGGMVIIKPPDVEMSKLIYAIINCKIRGDYNRGMAFIILKKRKSVVMNLFQSALGYFDKGYDNIDSLLKYFPTGRDIDFDKDEVIVFLARSQYAISSDAPPFLVYKRYIGQIAGMNSALTSDAAILWAASDLKQRASYYRGIDDESIQKKLVDAGLMPKFHEDCMRLDLDSIINNYDIINMNPVSGNQRVFVCNGNEWRIYPEDSLYELPNKCLVSDPNPFLKNKTYTEYQSDLTIVESSEASRELKELMKIVKNENNQFKIKAKEKQKINDSANKGLSYIVSESVGYVDGNIYIIMKKTDFGYYIIPLSKFSFDDPSVMSKKELIDNHATFLAYNALLPSDIVVDNMQLKEE